MQCAQRKEIPVPRGRNGDYLSFYAQKSIGFPSRRYMVFFTARKMFS